METRVHRDQDAVNRFVGPAGSEDVVKVSIMFDARKGVVSPVFLWRKIQGVDNSGCPTRMASAVSKVALSAKNVQAPS